ncbi:hypothetical protein M0R45_009753 [Rubus argutus]|uniref:Topoisomerase 6 subunit A/Spo11 TOPRIM domain-containing protein n=1 Tax=Rubus argutus TaxID=59490 RepID=A0AAW1Y7Y9_RUBAR
MPDVATRYLLCKLAREFGLRVYGLFDSNPYGVRILCIYRYGSMNKSYDYRNLITPNISWLGIKPTDLGTYGIPDDEKCRVPMTTNDRNLCQSLIDAEYLKDNAKWRRELQCMKKIGTKTEIEAFYTFGYKSLANVFIAHKLQQWKL